MASMFRMAVGGALVAAILTVASTGRSATPDLDTGPDAPKAIAEGGGVRLRSVGFALPFEGRAFPPGPGVELVEGNCAACHSAGMILTQPPLTRADWTGEVTKMVRVYKAPIDEADMPAIVSYLVGLKTAP